LPVWGDYMQELELPELPKPARTVVFFPGSTIGNFDPLEAQRFLRKIRGLCGPDGALLIGVDLKKDKATLEAAYDDRAGVTAEFNKNILRVINSECGARFALESFAHRAVYNERAGRVEMHLVSKQRQTVDIGFERIRFEEGEPIVTEHCYKYDVEQFRDLARKAGFEPERIWTDAERRFSVQLLC
jgi:dimethylhistidine N-methyltransferase